MLQPSAPQQVADALRRIATGNAVQCDAHFFALERDAAGVEFDGPPVHPGQNRANGLRRRAVGILAAQFKMAGIEIPERLNRHVKGAIRDARNALRLCKHHKQVSGRLLHPAIAIQARQGGIGSKQTEDVLQTVNFRQALFDEPPPARGVGLIECERGGCAHHLAGPADGNQWGGAGAKPRGGASGGRGNREDMTTSGACESHDEVL